MLRHAESDSCETVPFYGTESAFYRDIGHSSYKAISWATDANSGVGAGYQYVLLEILQRISIAPDKFFREDVCLLERAVHEAMGKDSLVWHRCQSL